MGTPASTAAIFKKAEEILPRVEPPLVSERLEELCMESGASGTGLQ